MDAKLHHRLHCLREHWGKKKIMEAQSSVFGISVAIHNPKTPLLYLTKASPFSTSKQVSLRTHSFASNHHLVLLAKNKVKIRASVEEVGRMKSTCSNNVEDNLREKITRKKNLAVFVSGGGSNFKSLHEATVNGFIQGDISVLVTNKPDCGGAEYARDKGIPVILFPKMKNGSGLSSKDLVNALRSYKVDFILLAGFLRLIPAELIQAFPRSRHIQYPSFTSSSFWRQRILWYEGA